MPLSPSLVGEYQICQRRGHTSQAYVYDPDKDKGADPWHVCTYCGTSYRTVKVLQVEEKNIPTMEEEVKAN